MRRDKLKANQLFSKVFIILALFLFVVLIARTSQLALASKIDGIDIKAFSSSLKTVKNEIKASRGSIFDSNGNILAQNVSSYTVVAYLSKTHTPYVTDKAMVAKQLAPLIGMTEDAIMTLLNKDLYQVELGPGGRNISQLLKDQIAALNIPGIDFTSSMKRYYSNGNYASYIIGYSKPDAKGIEQGEMGIEKYYNNYLTGIDGFSEYTADRLGTKIANTKEIVQKETDGSDVYLTLDTNIQLFVEQAVKTMYDTALPEWATVVVADAKTGAILGSSSVPSFNPNIRDITNYLNPLTSIAYEPGSTMKIFTYMAALETGKYNGTDTYSSGSIKFGDDTIKDWNKGGWGTITYDQGFALSSNVAVSTMFQRGLVTKKTLKDYYTKLGFGSLTGITLPNEVKGTINFKYDIETANATFGQGINTTTIQNIQALTAVSNNGIILSPYIVDRIVSKNGEIVYQGGKNEIERVASEATVNKVKELMKNVMVGTSETCTGYRYYLPQYGMIGKTGTAQISDTVNGGYLTGYNDYIRTFAGIFPGDNPQIIIYAAMKKGSNASIVMADSIKSITESIGKYLNINQDQSNSVENVSYTLPSYINKNIIDVTKDLQAHGINPIIIGNGTKVINQYPTRNTVVTYIDKTILLTNSSETLIPNFTGWSRKDFTEYALLAGIKYEITGSGYVSSQSIGVNTKYNNTDVMKVVLASRIPEVKSV